MEHHVYFWLKEEFKSEESRKQFEEGLGAMLRVPTVSGGIWGISAATPERPVTEKSWDYALSVHFDSLADHDAYQVHPDHDVFVNQFKDWWERVQVMDVQPT